MERSEPTLVPEWLRSTGSVAGGGNPNHHFPSSSSHSGSAFFLSFFLFSFLLLHASNKRCTHLLLTCLYFDIVNAVNVYPMLLCRCSLSISIEK